LLKKRYLGEQCAALVLRGTNGRARDLRRPGTGAPAQGSGSRLGDADHLQPGRVFLGKVLD